jgi:multiple sugar transport system ATP-binding protein
MARVELQNVTKSYDGVTPAVRDLNLEIASGEFLCILGPSGCGKSSTLRMVAGLEEVTSGLILVNGQNIVGTPARERDIAMVFENYALYPHLTVHDNIAMPLVAARRPKQEIRERVQRIAAEVGITEQLSNKPGRLSGGQRQRVSLARAMIRRPKMFLMDEPLGHLEAYLRVELRRQIRALHEEAGGTTLYITHDQEEAAAVADRIAVMAGGDLLQVGTMRDLIDRPANRFVAEFVGEPPIMIFEDVGLFEGTLHLGDLAVPLPDRIRRAVGSCDIAALGVRPTHMEVCGPDSGGLSARATSVQPMGEWGLVVFDTPAGQASAVMAAHHLPALGETARLRPNPERLQIFDTDGRNLSARED